MKSIVLRLMLVLAAFAMVPDAFAADTGGGNVFLDAKFGKMFGKPNGDGADLTDTASNGWGAEGGYLWKLDDQRALGFDVGYMHFGHILDENFALEFSRGSISASAVTAGAHFQYLFGDAWCFRVRAGFMRMKFDETFSSFTPGQPAFSGSDSSHQSGVYYGGGIGRNITQSLSLSVAYERFSSSLNDQGSRLGLNWIGLVTEYRF